MSIALLRVDLHVHTSYSPDARMSPAALVERAVEVGLDRIAVTDHHEIEGALLARSLDAERVIVGEEIRCRGRTELIGLFLEERIPPGLPFDETVARIRDQGGVVYAPHPYAYALRPAWQAERVLQVADVVEVYNARAFLPRWNRRALEEAQRRNLPVAASSDAHRPEELGAACTLVPPFEGPGGFLEAVATAQAIDHSLSSPLVHVVSAGWRAARALGWGVPAQPEPADSVRRLRPSLPPHEGVRRSGRRPPLRST